MLPMKYNKDQHRMEILKNNSGKHTLAATNSSLVGVKTSSERKIMYGARNLANYLTVVKLYILGGDPRVIV